MKSQNFLFLNLCLAFITLINSACVEQKPSLANSPPNVVAENLSEVSSGDAEIDAAQKVIEKAPEMAVGYNKLAIVYIRRARETGDFSLNSKAQTAVSRALEIQPDNYDAKKLEASLLLTFHRFQEALKAATELQQTHPQDSFIYGVLTDSNVELGNYQQAMFIV